MICKLVLRWTLLGESILNALHYDIGSTPLDELQPYVDYIADQFAEQAAANISDDMVFIGANAYDVSTPEPIGIVYSPTAGPEPGLDTTGNLPPFTAVLIRSFALNTEYPHSVRMYLGGVTEARNDAAGRPDINLILAAGDFVNALNALVVAEQPTLPRVAVRYNSVGQVIASAQVFGATVSAKYGVQRRRNYG